MNVPPLRPPGRDRPHLVERAVEAMGVSLSGAEPRAATAPAAMPPPTGASASLAPSSPRPAETPPPAPIGREALTALGLMVGSAQGARSRISEEYSVVQHAVLRTVRATPSVDGRCGRLIMITSARPGEGKTFTALNLAAALAQGSQRAVVLVDCDGKVGSLTDRLGLRDQVGLCCLAADPQSRGSPPLQPTAVPRLSVLGYGRSGRPGSPPPATLGAVLLRLANAYPDHLFVLDTPPCLATAEASLLAPVVGQVVMVVQAQATQRAELEAALDLVDTCPNIELLLNRSLLRGHDSFGAYGYDDYHAPAADRS
ncbi:MAG: hypothetical protein NZM07_01060 [Elioraea sp.]|nr:hypothetical protein [Elioraea sp.]